MDPAKLRDRPANDLLRRPTEHSLGLLGPARHPELRVELDDRQWRVIKVRAHVLLALRGAFTASLANRTPFHAQARVRRADGKWRWIETFSQPRLD